ncbi:Hypothetical protein SMAX5B_003376, partial [Scophthalmus maximus]
EKPEVTLTVQGKQIKFLCDSGASRTVVNPEDPLSKPIKITDPETGKSRPCQVVLSYVCPCYPLGRDMMQSLGIATVPTAKGLKALRMTSCLVIQDETPIHYWY